MSWEDRFYLRDPSLPRRWALSRVMLAGCAVTAPAPAAGQSYQRPASDQLVPEARLRRR